MRKIIFFGSSPFSNIVLEKIKDQCVAVITTEDKPVGRGLKITPNPVKVLAQKYQIPVYESPTDLKITDEVGLVAAYGKIIKSEILSKFKDRIFNIHPSLLPKYRGPSPLQQQILDGVFETGVTIIQLDEQMDHGPIVEVEKDRTSPDDTWISLGERLFARGAELFLNSSLTNRVEQDHSAATYTHKLTRQDGFVPYAEFEPAKLERKFRAYFNWPGVWTINPEGKRLKLISLNPIKIQDA